MKERIKKIFEESISIVSFTNTKTERDIEDYIHQYMLIVLLWCMNFYY